MIGVIPKLHQVPIAEELFQLFKTPWELWRPGRAYEVVIATTDEIPDVAARLLLIYGSSIKNTDAGSGVRPRSRRCGGRLAYRGRPVPIHRDLLTFDSTGSGVPTVLAGSDPAVLRFRSADAIVIRFGYDLFEEVECLLSIGQPVDCAPIPALDVHIMMLRDSMLDAGITLLEIPAAPAGHRFIACLTHDIDFVGIRHHKLDHTMWGFLYRATVGAIRNFCRRRLTARRLFEAWRAAAALPFVYLGWARDFWNPFDWYLQVEKHLPATYFLIPFKRRPGEHVAGRHSARRAAAYDITDVPQWSSTLLNAGCELGVHGIDAWHSVEKGRSELARLAPVSGDSRAGIRMHWLLRKEDTFRILEEAGYAYDSTVGYNETVGYRSGTTQVFRPLTAHTLLELPLHIQDGALFFPRTLDLSPSEAWTRCLDLIDNAERFGGVLTVLWHDRSHGPERFWGDFYVRLVQALKSRGAWFATGAQTTGWFQARRDVRFERVETAAGSVRIGLRGDGDEVQPPLNIRVHRPRAGATHVGSCAADMPAWDDIPWNARMPVEVDLAESMCSLS